MTRVAVKNAPQKAPSDPIFFSKEDISVGVHLHYFGATGRAEWVVEDITTLLRDKSGHHEETIETVRVISDVVHLRRLKGGFDRRRVSFSYLRYSAIWRLEM